MLGKKELGRVKKNNNKRECRYLPRSRKAVQTTKNNRAVKRWVKSTSSFKQCKKETGNRCGRTSSFEKKWYR